MPRDFWNGRPVLVTGGTGLLGGWLVRELVNRNAEVVALVRDSMPRSMMVAEGWINRVSVVHGSVTDLDLVRRTLTEYSVATVFHLAAQTQVGAAERDPASTLEANVRGTWQVLEAARLAGKPQVLVASSDKAYGICKTVPYEETHPLAGTFPYDVSKSCADLISSMYATTYQLPVGIVRCGNLFGGGDLNFARLVPSAICATLRGESFLIRSNGKLIRDYLYVEDAVDGYLGLAEKLADDATLRGEAFNFSLGLRFTVLEMLELINDLMDRHDLPPIIQDSARYEIPEQQLSAEKARRRLGWEPRFGLRQGLARTIEWYREYVQRSGGMSSSTLALSAGAGR